MDKKEFVQRFVIACVGIDTSTTEEDIGWALSSWDKIEAWERQEYIDSVANACAVVSGLLGEG